MRHLDKLILKELTLPFIFGLGAFVVMMMSVFALGPVVKMVLNFSISAGVVQRLLVYKLPEVVAFTLPMAMLVTGLLSYGRLSGDNELVALRAGGIHFGRILTPALLVGLAVSVMTILLNEKVVPVANQAYERLRWEVRNPMSDLLPKQSNVFLREMEDGELKQAIFAGTLDGDKLMSVHRWTYQDGALAEYLIAPMAAWREGDQWEFPEGGEIIQYSSDGRERLSTKFERGRIIRLGKTPEDIVHEPKSSTELTFWELRRKIDSMIEEGADRKSILGARVELHQKIAVPFAAFFFTLLGAPLGIRNIRSSYMIGMAFSIPFIMLYYVLLIFGRAWGGSGAIPPFLGAWLPNAAALLIGTVVMVRQSRR